VDQIGLLDVLVETGHGLSLHWRYNMVMIEDVLTEIKRELKANSDEKTRASSKRFFKEEVKMYGVRSADGKRIANEAWKLIKDWQKEEIFSLVEQMYQSGMAEEQWMAADLIYRARKHYEQHDMERFEQWIGNYITNWASCDTFCNHAVGTLVETYPKEIGRLKRWTKSDNRWMRRASVVALIVPAKEGKFLHAVFELADILLLDKDDMVQKGYGWLLKEASRKHQQEVFEFVVKHKRVMPRTALRYAIEKMPQDLRKQAMARD
jgi:3-methyladenine DNA glycosylase AlkD